jgi:tellurite resistance protein TerC
MPAEITERKLRGKFFIDFPSRILKDQKVMFPTVPEIVSAIPVIFSLIIIEGLLSVDNALAIAAMASHLPGKQKLLALRWGIFGAYAFRGLAIAFAAFIVNNPWLKIVGAAYLIHLMASFFAERAQPAKQSEEEDKDGKNGTIVAFMAAKGFWATVVSIELMDLSLSVDNVVAAVALSPKLWVVCTGVFIGILALRFVAGFCIKLIERFPILECTAFLLIGYVGLILVVELCAHTMFRLAHPVEITALQKFIGIMVVLALSVWYSESMAVRTVVSPILRICRLPFLAYARISNFVFGMLFFPFKYIWSLFEAKPAGIKGKTS